MKIPTPVVKELREKTKLGMMDCKEALIKTEGDVERAIVFLREKGKIGSEKRQGRVTRHGVVAAYMHHNSQVCGVVELNCKTDFVARSDEFKGLAHDLAMQVVAVNPSWIGPCDVPQGVYAQKVAICRAQAEKMGKPPKVIDKIVTGMMKKFGTVHFLQCQPFVKDDTFEVEEILQEAIRKFGENISIKRFQRFQVGEDL